MGKKEVYKTHGVGIDVFGKVKYYKFRYVHL